MSEQKETQGHQVNLTRSKNRGTIVAGDSNTVGQPAGDAADEGPAWKKIGIAAGVVSAVAAVIALFLA